MRRSMDIWIIWEFHARKTSETDRWDGMGWDPELKLRLLEPEMYVHGIHEVVLAKTKIFGARSAQDLR